jgi:hypothetical protein
MTPKPLCANISLLYKQNRKWKSGSLFWRTCPYTFAYLFIFVVKLGFTLNIQQLAKILDKALVQCLQFWLILEIREHDFLQLDNLQTLSFLLSSAIYWEMWGENNVPPDPSHHLHQQATSSYHHGNRKQPQPADPRVTDPRVTDPRAPDSRSQSKMPPPATRPSDLPSLSSNSSLSKPGEFSEFGPSALLLCIIFCMFVCFGLIAAVFVIQLNYFSS